MDNPEILKKYHPIIKKNLLPIALGLFGLIFLGYGLIALFGESKAWDKDIVFKPGQEYSLKNEAQIKVDVAGQVLEPGVYNLMSDSRIQDVLVAAGGLSENADREWVSKNINLAQKLVDGTKIYIPKIGELETESITRLGLTSPSFAGQADININTATIEMLDGLPGIGLVTAQKIIDYRPYSTIEDLISKKVVGEKVFGEIREKITVY